MLVDLEVIKTVIASGRAIQRPLARWYIEDPDELHSVYETEVPGPDTKQAPV